MSGAAGVAGSMSDPVWFWMWAVAIGVLVWLSGYFFGRTDEIMRRVRQMEREAEKRRVG